VPRTIIRARDLQATPEFGGAVVRPAQLISLNFSGLPFLYSQNHPQAAPMYSVLGAQAASAEVGTAAASSHFGVVFLRGGRVAAALAISAYSSKQTWRTISTAPRAVTLSEHERRSCNVAPSPLSISKSGGSA
jgi:hypothetical protein